MDPAEGYCSSAGLPQLPLCSLETCLRLICDSNERHTSITLTDRSLSPSLYPTLVVRLLMSLPIWETSDFCLYLLQQVKGKQVMDVKMYNYMPPPSVSSAVHPIGSLVHPVHHPMHPPGTPEFQEIPLPPRYPNHACWANTGGRVDSVCLSLPNWSL